MLSELTLLQKDNECVKVLENDALIEFAVRNEMIA